MCCAPSIKNVPSKIDKSWWALQVLKMENQTLKRFVILRHTPGELFERTEKVHLDWMFEDSAQLRTFSTSNLVTEIGIQIRKKVITATVVKTPFYKR